MKQYKRFIIPLLLLVVVVIFLASQRAKQEEIISVSGMTMGTTYQVKIVQPGDVKLDAITLKRLIDNRLNGIDGMMSTYKQDSEISQFNLSPTNTWVPVSPETFTVIRTGQQISALSQGAFDMTVGALVNLWGFGPTLTTAALPPAEKISELRDQTGFQKLILQETPPAVMKASQAVTLDLSAIAKGYAVDAVSELLAQNGLDRFLVEIGGELVARGRKTAEQPWMIGVERPQPGQRSVEKLVPLENSAMATSGDYRNYFEQDGVRYSHTIDPATGYPITHQLASVTVVAKDCMHADALATALMVMGPDKGMRFAELNQLATLMLVKQGDQFTEIESTAFTAFLDSGKL
ncbi:MAG: FAD:protein FMN transferase ApbE [Desulfuromonas sp.]|nr:MAG: FAD:protein FMN transferase ApbE [Desulfuromonas sp.]